MQNSLDSKEVISWFRNNATPYINLLRDKVIVVALGGDLIASGHLHSVIHDLALLHSLGLKLVVVNGAELQINTLLETANIESDFYNGRRITHDTMMPFVQAACAGNRAIVEGAFTEGLTSSPMHGATIRVVSGNIVIAKPVGVIGGVDHKRTGEVRKIDTHTLTTMLDNRWVVSISNLGYSRTGNVLNLAYEEVATQTAIALKAEKLIFMTNGHMEIEASTLNPQQVETIIQNPQQLSEAQLRSLQQAQSASRNGVRRAHFVDYTESSALLQELFSREGHGLMVTYDEVETFGRASTEDIAGILNLIRPLEEKGILVARSQSYLEANLDYFFVMRKDAMVVGCISVHPYAQHNTAEIACVAVHDEYRGNQLGYRLLECAQAHARQLGLDEVFVLTTRTEHWFLEQGFIESSPHKLPPEKQQAYNASRQSKVLCKAL